MDKLTRLRGIIKKAGSLLVAYSGGADSTFLLKVARDVLKDNVVAVTADSPTYTKEELIFARKMARSLGARHKVINTQELGNKNFSSNPVNRCYFCKSELFRRLKKIAWRNRLNFVTDASNISDKKDYRPGSIAKAESGVRSLLQEAGFTKKEIRKFSRKLGLVTWDRPQAACLASRIPYGIKISRAILSRIGKAESFLRQLGFRQVRFRHYNGLCRIEVPEQDIRRLINKRELLLDKLSRLGYKYITVDLEGYRSGSLNEVLKK